MLAGLHAIVIGEEGRRQAKKDEDNEMRLVLASRHQEDHEVNWELTTVVGCRCGAISTSNSRYLEEDLKQG